LVKSLNALSTEQIERKLRLATSALQTHLRTRFANRVRMMLCAAEILEKEKDEYTRLMTLEVGKTLRSGAAEAVKCGAEAATMPSMRARSEWDPGIGEHKNRVSGAGPKVS
jgi:acyl-CoA reductase-like NAD-dependent aldehyde dehydrogenase